MIDARECHSSLVIRQQVFVFCGNDGRRNLNTVEIMDLCPRQGPMMTKSDPVWEILTPSIAPRQMPIVSAIDDALVMILGGVGDDS